MEPKAGKVLHLTLREESCNQSCVAKLEQLLERAKSGEVIAISGIAELRGGSYFVYSTATLSRTQTAGALLDAAISRLSDDE